MSASSAPNLDDPEETILEFVIRERLTKEQIVELSAALGGPKQGSRDDLAERLLAIRGLKAKDALSKLSTDDLKLVARRFDVPESQKPSTASGFLGQLLGDERASLVKRIDEVASKQRPPRPAATIDPGTQSAAAASPVAPLELEAPVTLRETRSAAAKPSVAEVRTAARPAPQPPAAVPGALGPGFDEVALFVEEYRFRTNWKTEESYEAEMFGALSTRFGHSLVERQKRTPGGIPDLRVKRHPKAGNAETTYVEMKVPKTSQECRSIAPQIQDYVNAGATSLIVVLGGSGGASPVQLEEVALKLEEIPVRVSKKYYH